MHCVAILLALVACTFAAPTNEYVDDALIARVADVIAKGGDGTAKSGGSSDASQYMDDSIYTRVAEALGAPYAGNGRSGADALGVIEPAELIAEWDLSDGSAAAAYSGASGAGSDLGKPEPAPLVTEWKV